MLLRSLVTSMIKQRVKASAMEAGAQALAGRSEGDEKKQKRGKPDDAEPPCEVAVVLALPIESGGLCDRLEDKVTTWFEDFVEHAGTWGGRGVVVVESGVGQAAAHRVTEATIKLHRPKWILSTGFAGSLVEGIERGDMVMADRVKSLAGDAAGQELEVGLNVSREALEATPGVHVGRLLTVGKIIGTTAEKRRLAEEHQAIAVDMETHGVARAAREAELRFLSVRVVSDGVDDELPKEIGRLMEQKSLAGKFGAVTGALFKRPGSAVDMWKLRERAIDASDRLAKFLEGVIAQLD